LAPTADTAIAKHLCIKVIKYYKSNKIKQYQKVKKNIEMRTVVNYKLIKTKQVY